MGAYVSSVIISQFDLETAHRAKIQIAAEYCSPSPPGFIADVLSHFSFDVYSQDSIDKISLTRKEASLLIAEWGTTAVNFVDALRNPSFRGLLARGGVDDDEKLQKQHVKGLFAPQSLLRDRRSMFWDHPLFDGFDILAIAADAEQFTLGVARVREADGMEGLSHRQAFFAKESDG